ncbi:cobalt-precorrin-5B (C(1))-methyltransferase CbiD [Enterocloster bolteae]|uniref:cobalt-precorrin-5B (C(1))-methyltransferase CbiD n=1 Tax=Enterocloster bolteae TaxID=208479 RepID=UPI000E4519B3|nr:cobalt-precorrin-5B (C(1))-methyltransferase CbiD [Enterocloster bolteae]RGK76441.1 cobalamin biosynthesis protein CbiD [Enterocloster bolteae]
MGDSYIYKNQKKLRWGYTTGTCAAAASLAAAVMLLRGRRMEQVSLTTPKGVRLDLEVEEMETGENCVCCGVRKDAGDDPDVTDGLMVYSQVRLPDADSGGAGDAREAGDDRNACGDYVYEKDGLRLILSGGVGVGRVTKCGLSCEVGKAAINPVPRQMIFEQVAGVCRESGFKGVLSIEIRVPEALKVADKTFNSRLGIQGGISILGTSGMVEPMSETALLDTIRLELRQRIRKGEKNLLVTPGNYGENFVGTVLGLGLGQAVKCSNFIGSTIDMAVEEGAESILLIGHGGKLIKLAAGIMNTHSSWADGRMEILAAHGAACGAKRELVEQIMEAVTVDEGLRLLETEDGLREQVMKRVMARLEQYVKRRAGGRLRAEVIVFTNERGILGATTGADDMLLYFTNRLRNR